MARTGLADEGSVLRPPEAWLADGYAHVMPRRRTAGLIVVLLAASAAAAFLLPHSISGLQRLLPGAGPALPLIALLAWTLLTPAMFPGSVLAAVCGAAFGALGGSLVAVAGAVAGGLAAFLLARG